MKIIHSITHPLFIVIVFSFLSCGGIGCDKVKDTVDTVLKRDLKITLVPKNVQDITLETPVIAVDNQSETVIGKIESISKSDKNDPLVNLNIYHQFKELVNSATLFVIKRPSFFSKTPIKILVYTPPLERKAPSPLSSGVVVAETAYTDYQILRVKQGFKTAASRIQDQLKDLVDDLDAYLESDEVDRFISELEKTAEELSEMSAKQKEKFQKEVLPELERKVEEAKKRFQEKFDKDKTRKLEEQLEIIRTEAKNV